MNCKPGDLAIVIRSRSHNEGSIVKVLRPATHPLAPNGKAWIIEYQRPVGACRRGVYVPPELRNPGNLKLTQTRCPDAWLRPVSGLKLDDEVDHELEVPSKPAEFVGD